MDCGLHRNDDHHFSCSSTAAVAGSAAPSGHCCAEEAVAVVLVESDKTLLLAGRSGAEAGALAHRARDPVLRQERVFEKDSSGAVSGARRSVARHGQGVGQQDVHHDVGGPTGADEGRGRLCIRPDAEPTEIPHNRGRW